MNFTELSVIVFEVTAVSIPALTFYIEGLAVFGPEIGAQLAVLE